MKRPAPEQFKMKKLILLFIAIALTGCTGMGGNGQGTANADKANPNDMTYRGGSL